MIVPIRAQKPLPMGGVAGDGVHIWNAELARIDEVLCDDELIHILLRSFQRTNRLSNVKGPPRMALNRTLRTFALKHIKDWSFRVLYNELQRNLDYRAFTQFFDEAIRSPSALSRNGYLIDAQAVRELNERLCELAREQNVIRGKVFREDTTVVETNVHYPTDSSQMADGNRVLTRLATRAKELVPSLGSVRNRCRATLHRVLEINRAARSRRPEAKDRMKGSYRSLMRITRSVVTDAKRIADKLGDGRVTRHLGNAEQAVARKIKQDLETMLPRVDTVIRQTRARINRGINDYPGKILSLFEPSTCAIRKGKSHKPTEFGRLVEIVEVEHGFVSDYQVHEGNPSDSSMLLPSLCRHIKRFGRPPTKVATDRGFFSAQNEKDAYALGVKKVSIPASGRLSATRLALQRTRWFRDLQRWRANGEGRIGTLKNRYGLDRCMYKGDEAMERWVGWAVFANNLVVFARKTQMHSAATCRDEEPHQTQRQGRRAAA